MKTPHMPIFMLSKQSEPKSNNFCRTAVNYCDENKLMKLSHGGCAGCVKSNKNNLRVVEKRFSAVKKETKPTS